MNAKRQKTIASKWKAYGYFLPSEGPHKGEVVPFIGLSREEFESYARRTVTKGLESSGFTILEYTDEQKAIIETPEYKAHQDKVWEWIQKVINNEPHGESPGVYPKLFKD